MIGTRLRRLPLTLAAARLEREQAARARWERAEAEAHQRAAIARLLRLAAEASPFYRRHWGVRAAAPERLDQLPPVRKADLRAHLDEVGTDRRLQRAAMWAHLDADPGGWMHGQYVILATSGTTGTPMLMAYSRSEWRQILAGALRWTGMLGVTPRLPRLRVASIGAPSPRHMTGRIRRDLDAGVHHAIRLSATAPIESLVRELQAHHPQALQCYPSILQQLVAAAEAGELTITPRMLSTSSEVLAPRLADRAAAVFGVRPRDAYALTEAGVVAVECEAHAGLHVFEDLAVLEVVDAGGSVAAADATGAATLVTSLVAHAFPMIRVEVSDQLEALPAQVCTCGRTTPRIGHVRGRSDELLHLLTPTGRRAIHPIALRSAIAGVRGVAQYAIAHDTRTGLHVRLAIAEPGVAGAPIAEAVRRAIKAVLHGHGAQDALAVDVVERIDVDPVTGKHAALLKPPTPTRFAP